MYRLCEKAIFDPSGVQNLIIRGAQAQHGANWQSIRPNYGLTDLVKYLYPGIIQSTTDVKWFDYEIFCFINTLSVHLEFSTRDSSISHDAGRNLFRQN